MIGLEELFIIYGKIILVIIAMFCFIVFNPLFWFIVWYDFKHGYGKDAEYFHKI